ncbi:MAG: hypothetical protein OXL40_05655 [Bacteroidota bacterium]|nr:hypothetical protein [Bacteroidota bacterium]
MRGLFQDLVDRRSSPDQGLLCITLVTASLSRILTECIGSQIRLQHCQMHKPARVVSNLATAEQRPIQGAISRALALPDLALARAGLLQVYTLLKSLNCSATLRLFHDLDRSLTFH